MTKKECNIILFSITLCWSSSYLFIKSLPEELSSYGYMAITTGMAGIAMMLMCIKQLHKIQMAMIGKSLCLALLLCGNLLTGKLGLMYMPSSMASFLSSLNIVMVPILLILGKKFPKKNQLLGMGIILLGILATNDFRMQSLNNMGTGWMLLACLLASVYTIMADKFTKEENPLLMSALQMIMCGAISFILWYLEDPGAVFRLSYQPQTISSLLVLTLFSKVYAYIMLMYAQKYANPMDVTVIASTEPVVTLILAVLLPEAYGAGEAVRFGAFGGSMLIALGAVVAGITFNGLFSNQKKTESNTELRYISTFIPIKQWIKKELTRRRIKQGIGIFFAFSFLGAAFKVMVLVEGFTEVRPVNAIPVAAGLIAGPLGGICCGLGNLVADFAGDWGATSILGVAANFIGAFLPYRLWYQCTKEEPKLDTFRNLGIYCLISFMSALAVAFIIGTGLDIIFHIQNPFIYQSVFVNNFAFSILLGMPLFILMTSKEFKVTCVKPINYYFLHGKKEKNAVMGIFTVAMVLVLFYMGDGRSISNSLLMMLLTEGAVTSMIVLLI